LGCVDREVAAFGRLAYRVASVVQIGAGGNGPRERNLGGRIRFAGRGRRRWGMSVGAVQW